jgi:hypothetical protein
MTSVFNKKYIWKLPLFNFLLAALLGTILRYHVYNPLPHFNYINWLQVHSHLMFLGWVTIALFILILKPLDVTGYESILVNSLVVFEIAVLIMFISFPMGGYGVLSVIVLSITMVIGLIFLWLIVKLSRQRRNAGWKFIASGLFFMAISSIGPLALGPVSAMGLRDTQWYNYAIYFYLHFQYNGWFFMAITGLIILGAAEWEETNRLKLRKACTMLNLAILLTFFLSVLGHGNTKWFNLLGGTGAIIQLIIMAGLIRSFIGYYQDRSGILNERNTALLKLAMLALMIKLLLQAFSAIPLLTEFIDSNRGVIIAYLHLVLIGFVSFAILFLYIRERADKNSNATVTVFSYILIAGFFLNEFVLLITVTGGIAIIVPQLLITASLIMVIGIGGLLASI